MAPEPGERGTASSTGAGSDEEHQTWEVESKSRPVARDRADDLDDSGGSGT
jgi:hypothetical protein